MVVLIGVGAMTFLSLLVALLKAMTLATVMQVCLRYLSGSARDLCSCWRSLMSAFHVAGALFLGSRYQWFAVLQGLAIALVQGTKDNTWNKQTISTVATYLNAINFGSRRRLRGGHGGKNSLRCER
jgi:hypothetical protein